MEERAVKAIGRLGRIEGWYSNDPKDPGGATMIGITLRYLMDLGEIDPDDGYLYGDMNRDGKIDIRDIQKLTFDEAMKIYYHEWWLELGYDKILSDRIAFRLLDQAVVSGPHQAHKVLQRAVNAVLGIPGIPIGSGKKLEQLKVDGSLGPKTVATVNALTCSEAMDLILENSYKVEAKKFFASLGKPYFLKGWINRVDTPV